MQWVGSLLLLTRPFWRRRGPAYQSKEEGGERGGRENWSHMWMAREMETLKGWMSCSEQSALFSGFTSNIMLLPLHPVYIWVFLLTTMKKNSIQTPCCDSEHLHCSVWLLSSAGMLNSILWCLWFSIAKWEWRWRRSGGRWGSTLIPNLS